MKKLLTSSILATTLPLAAQAAPVDLTGWIENGFKGNNGAGTWTVSGTNDTVTQSTNGQPTVFFKDGDNAQGTALSGTIRVNTTSDDDYIGFVLGYQDGEMNSTAADFWLIDWKQGNQTSASRGIALSHVTGDIANGGSADPSFWAHTDTVSEVARGANLGDTGWADHTEYSFDLKFTASLIEVWVDNVLEISYAGSFTDGAFGFYNYSQANVIYAGITEDIIPDPTPAIPLPASLPLMLVGLGALGLIRRKQG